ncbi:MAG TPA: hypothetical protein EYP04_13255, partial [Anaerolineae bacterium]|nr:hypothetical protein [Anaerolineae bacterium]
MKRPHRFRSPLMPVTPPHFGERLLISLEKLVKGVLFDCSMCGNCLLQETAFICPMLCPKGLRNGPCGSGTLECCCVDPSRPCIWHLIYQRAEELGRLDRLLEVQAPLDWSRVGHETWATVVRQAREHGLLSPMRLGRGRGWGDRVESVLREIRQPDWWQGDASYHPPAQAIAASRLQAALQRGEFGVTAEVTPPPGASAEKVIASAAQLRGLIHA